MKGKADLDRDFHFDLDLYDDFQFISSGTVELPSWLFLKNTVNSR